MRADGIQVLEVCVDLLVVSDPLSDPTVDLVDVGAQERELTLNHRLDQWLEDGGVMTHEVLREAG